MKMSGQRGDDRETLEYAIRNYKTLSEDVFGGEEKLLSVDKSSLKNCMYPYVLFGGKICD